MTLRSSLRPARSLWPALLTCLVLAGAALAGPAQGGTPRTAGDSAPYVVSTASVAARAAVIDDAGLRPTARFDSAVIGFAADLTSTEAARLRVDDRVVGITPSGVVRGASAGDSARVLRSVEADQAPVSAGSGAPLAWDGPAVAVLDSGVYPHPDLNLMSSATPDAAGVPRTSVDCTSGTAVGEELAPGANNHGTAIAGMIGALDNEVGTVGVAPGVPIYSVHMLSQSLQGNVSGLLCALDWVRANHVRLNIRHVNMSFAARGEDDNNCGYTAKDPVHQAICDLAERGVSMVAGAGNAVSGAAAPSDLSQAVPASYGEVLAATNIVDFDGVFGADRPVAAPTACSSSDPASPQTDDTPNSTSNFAVSAADQAHTLGAPGTCLRSTIGTSGYAVIPSGTSSASASLSGVVLNCLRATGACVDPVTGEYLSSEGTRRTVVAQAQASADRGHTYTGDPTNGATGRYYGFLASTVPTGTGPVVPSPAPVITGTRKIGATLNVTLSAWTPTQSTYAFEWLVAGKVVGTARAYTVKSTDGGQSLSVRVTGTPPGASPVVRTSTVAVPRGVLTAVTPKITGTAKVGRTLKVSTGIWKPSGVKLARQWYVNGAAVRGATGASWKVAKSAKGKRVTVKVTGSRAGYTTRSALSAKTGKVAG